MTAATDPDLSPEAVVEELTFTVAPDELGRWLAADGAAWDDLLAGCPGFLGKEVWVADGPPALVQVVIWWASRAAPERLPDSAQADADRRMGDLHREPRARHLRVARRLAPRADTSPSRGLACARAGVRRPANPDDDRGARAMDVLEHLTQEHRQVEDLLAKLSEADGGERPALIDELERSLRVHMAVEEQYLYPLVAQVMDAETEEEAETEHELAREGVAKLREMAAQPGFGAVVNMVAAGIRHHVEEEEQEVFPQLRKKAGEEIAALDPEALEADVTSGAGGDEATKAELYEQAQEAGIEGRSTMTKDELRAALAGRG